MTAAPRSAHRLMEFPSQGATLRGRLYEHHGAPRPTVVMGHGFTATITGMVADRYAEVLHAAGLNVLLFDHRSFGLSGGEPRLVLNRWIQARGYRDALDFMTTLPTADASRLGIWGDSMSGSVALGVAAFDERVQAVVVQVPACGSEPPPADPDGTSFRALRDTFLIADVESNPKATIGPMAVVSPDQIRSPSLLEPITAFRWFIEYGGRPGTGWQNSATYVVPDTPVPYHPGLCAPHMHGASLWVIATDDEMPGAEPPVALAAFESAPHPKELLEIDGGHFGLLYYPSPLFDQVSAAQSDFLMKHLGGHTRGPMTDLATNVLYYGDNLDILRRYLPDAAVDLVYLDPPFNSNRDYNVIFRDESGNATDAQLLAFEDTWHWGPSAEATYAYLTNTARHEGRVPDKVSTIIAALRAGIGENISGVGAKPSRSAEARS